MPSYLGKVPEAFPPLFSQAFPGRTLPKLFLFKWSLAISLVCTWILKRHFEMKLLNLFYVKIQTVPTTFYESSDFQNKHKQQNRPAEPEIQMPSCLSSRHDDEADEGSWYKYVLQCLNIYCFPFRKLIVCMQKGVFYLYCAAVMWKLNCLALNGSAKIILSLCNYIYGPTHIHHLLENVIVHHRYHLIFL